MRTNGEVYEKIKSVLTRTFKVNDDLIQEDANLDMLGLDSIELMDAICFIEEEFKIKIFGEGEENVQVPNTVGELVALVSQRVQLTRPPKL